MASGFNPGFLFDLIGLSTEAKPTVMPDGTPVQDGSTFYEVDTMKFYIFYKNEWYLQEEVQEETQDAQNEGE